MIMASNLPACAFCSRSEYVSSLCKSEAHPPPSTLWLSTCSTVHPNDDERSAMLLVRSNLPENRFRR